MSFPGRNIAWREGAKNQENPLFDRLQKCKVKWVARNFKLLNPLLLAEGLMRPGTVLISIDTKKYPNLDWVTILKRLYFLSVS